MMDAETKLKLVIKLSVKEFDELKKALDEAVRMGNLSWDKTQALQKFHECLSK